MYLHLQSFSKLLDPSIFHGFIELPKYADPDLYSIIKISLSLHT